MSVHANHGKKKTRTPPAAPDGIRFETLLTIGEEIDAAAPADDFATWAAACPRLDSIAYALRLIEAQLAAGNSGPGMLPLDKDLLV